MSLQKTIDDAIINAIADKVTEKIQREFRAQWGSMISEWANSRQAIKQVTQKLENLEALIHQQTQVSATNLQERQRLHQAANEALTILQTAKKELGLE